MPLSPFFQSAVGLLKRGNISSDENERRQREYHNRKSLDDT
jgi:hypothetical protein